MTAAMYTGEPTPIRKRCVPIFKYRCIRPTGNVTLALCDFDIAFWRFLPPLADMVTYVFGSKFTITTAPTQNNVNRIILRYHWMTCMKMVYINNRRKHILPKPFTLVATGSYYLRRLRIKHNINNFRILPVRTNCQSLKNVVSRLCKIQTQNLKK
jgi:hypothetical protein